MNLCNVDWAINRAFQRRRRWEVCLYLSASRIDLINFQLHTKVPWLHAFGDWIVVFNCSWDHYCRSNPKLHLRCLLSAIDVSHLHPFLMTCPHPASGTPS